jgi:hypothetical protein
MLQEFRAWSRAIGFEAVGFLLLLSWGPTAHASAIYGVISTVEVSSGNGPTTFPTQLVNFNNGGNPEAVTSYTSPVLTASGSFTFGASTVSGSGTTWDSSDGGTLHGYSTAAMSGVCQTCSSATEDGGLFDLNWYDTLTIGGLPSGTPVQLLVTNLLNSSTSRSGNATTELSSSLSVGSGNNAIDNDQGANDGLVTMAFVVNTTSGASLELVESLQAELSMNDGSNEFPSSSATIDASDTSEAFINVLTPGATYTTASGVTYASIPEPHSLELVGMALALCGALRRSRVRR